MACYIDLIAADGSIEGWAKSDDSSTPCHVQIRLGEQVIAETIANRFRRDLLQVGLGHGHYAFVARMRTKLPAGRYAFECYDGRTNTRFGDTAGELMTVPEWAQSKAAQSNTVVESLVVAPAEWEDDDVLPHISCLNLGANLEQMGVARFVDVTFKYVLNRWADPDGAQRYAQALNDREITPEQFFSILMGSGERKAIRAPLPSPFDYRFPYTV